jgi:molecular chaperone GrpE
MSDDTKRPDKIRMEDVLGSDIEDENDSDRIEVIDADKAASGEEPTPTIPRSEADGPPRALSAEEEELRTALEEKEKYHELWIRARADFDNYSKRVQRESDEQRRMAGSEMLERILPVLDNLQRALADDSDGPAFREGISLITKQLVESLTSMGLEPILAIGEPFDPVYHEAVATQVDSGQPPNTVLEEAQKGYMFKGRVLRHSMVRVAVAREGSEEAGDETPDAEPGAEESHDS